MLGLCRRFSLLLLGDLGKAHSTPTITRRIPWSESTEETAAWLFGQQLQIVPEQESTQESFLDRARWAEER